jgi:multidrug efflux pump subunit AcrB
MNCEYHQDRQETTECNVCKKPLCAECAKIQEKFGACAKCAKKQIDRVYQNYKQGLKFNIMSIVCFVAFLIVYVVDVCIGNLSIPFIIFGAVITVVLGVLSVLMLVKTTTKLKEYGKIIKKEGE